MAVNNMGSKDYEPFKKKQEMLSAIIRNSSNAISKLNMQQYEENLNKLQTKVKNDTFKIQIVGAFSNGKSTFINSFLGDEILPAYNLPCTAVINEVKYGEQKKAVLHFLNEFTENTRLTDIPEKAMRHMKKYNMKNIPPMEIPYDDIEDYVVIPIGKDPKEAIKESPFEKVELFWPMDLLKNGVEIIDSPGLNDSESRTKVTMEYLTKADAIIFLLRADQLCTLDEMNFIEYNLKGNGFENPFFVVNRFDLVRDREKATMKTYAYSKLKEFTSFGESGFFFVSALNALDGKMDNDEEKYRNSGMQEFEKRLSEFLTKEKGIVKLSQPAREIKRILSTEALYKVIPQEKKLLESSLDDVKKRYEKVKPKLRDLQTKKQNLKERIDLKIKMALPDIQKCVTQYTSDLSRSIPAWCNECSPSVNLGVIPNKDKTNRAATEIVEYVNGQIEKNQIEWKNNTLVPLVEEKINDVFGSVESDVQKFFDEIDNIQVTMSGEQNIKTNNVPTWQRVAGVVGGLAIGDIGTAVSGGLNGFSKDMAKTIGLEMGAGFVLGLLGLFNPVTLIATIGVAIFYNLSKSKNRMLENVKSQVSDEVIKQLNNNKDENVEKTISVVYEKLSGISTTIIDAVDIEIKEVDKQVKDIIAEMEKGQANIDKKKAELENSESEIKQILSYTDEFILDLIG